MQKRLLQSTTIFVYWLNPLAFSSSRFSDSTSFWAILTYMPLTLFSNFLSRSDLKFSPKIAYSKLEILEISQEYVRPTCGNRAAAHHPCNLMKNMCSTRSVHTIVSNRTFCTYKCSTSRRNLNSGPLVRTHVEFLINRDVFFSLYVSSNELTIIDKTCAINYSNGDIFFYNWQ